MKKLFLAAALALVASACGVPPAGDAPSSTTSRGDALETHGDTLPPVHLDIGEPLDIVVDLTDARIVERAGRPLAEESFFYSPFGGGGHCGCGCR